MGKYDYSQERELDNDDLQHDLDNGNLSRSYATPGTYIDGDGNRYDKDYNQID